MGFGTMHRPGRVLDSSIKDWSVLASARFSVINGPGAVERMLGPCFDVADTARLLDGVSRRAMDLPPRTPSAARLSGRGAI